MKHIHDDLRIQKKSLNALKLASELKLKLAKGEKINKTALAVSNGYSLKSARAQKPYKTKTFLKAMSNTVSVLDEVRAKSLDALMKKNLDKEKYRDLVSGVDILTKNSRLLADKSTENTAINIVTFGDNDFLTEQVSKQ